MEVIENYEEQVYASVLGKIFGVYMGRPFEGWDKTKIEEKWGNIDRYVNDDLGHDLVVADDDITGTFTFVRALEDSLKYADTSDEFFGDTWMNYLVEGKTILWWGGMGVSTEHTAYLRLKNGIKAPMSGSCALNGKTVSEQIGAQIFIDAIGMCFPGDMDRAAALAKKAASVSHDGEAVYAAQVVAVMVSMAFIEKDMNALLDKAMEYIPADSLIAEIHKNVRAWCIEDGDWRKTYDRIKELYGYQIYGGNCHVIPNHAIMVMAWAYAPDDFHESQIIINTAGWDTDCNAANVGSVMGLVVGLDRINERYDYQSPVADRVLMPTAEGSRGTSDALLEAGYIANIGRKCMDWPEVDAPKNGAWLHFSQAGAVHGFRSERDNVTLSNVQMNEGERALKIAIHGSVKDAHISKPILIRGDTQSSNYGLMGTPRLYAGYGVSAQGTFSGALSSLNMFIRYDDADGNEQIITEACKVSTDHFNVKMIIPHLPGSFVKDFGFECSGKDAEIFLDAVHYDAIPIVYMPNGISTAQNWHAQGWIHDTDIIRPGFSDDQETQSRVGKNQGRGLAVCGNTDWQDYKFSTRLNIHLASEAGVMARYQGRERYYAFIKTPTTFKLICYYYQEYVLAETAADSWEVDEFHKLALHCKGSELTAFCDDQEIFTVHDDRLINGGAGVVFADGIIGFREYSVLPQND